MRRSRFRQGRGSRRRQVPRLFRGRTRRASPSTASSPCSGAKRKPPCDSCAPATGAGAGPLARLFVHPARRPCGAKCAQPRWTATGGFAPALETNPHQLKQRADAESIACSPKTCASSPAGPALGAQNILAVGPRFPHRLQIVCTSTVKGTARIRDINPHAGSDKVRTEAGKRLPPRQETRRGSRRRGQRHRRARNRSLHPGVLPGWSIPVVMVSESGASVYSA